MKKYKTVYIDCTLTFYSGVNTGIQRVVRNIIKRLPQIEKEQNIVCKPVIAVRGKLYVINPERVLESRPITASIGARVKFTFDNIKKFSLLKTKKISAIHFMCSFILDKIEWLLKNTFGLIKLIRVLKCVHSDGNIQVKATSEDIILLADAFWIYNIQKILSFGNHGAGKVASIIYDLIPIHFSQYVEDSDGKHYLNALPKLIKLSDEFYGISKTVADEMQNYILKYYPELSPEKKVDYFYLGADFISNNKNDTVDNIRPVVKSIFDHHKTWLVVSTVEPRKNHNYILDAFDKIWDENGTDKLFIIGRIGWKCDQILERIIEHPEYNKKLFYMWDISDDELKYCYKHSAGLIFASHVEGFGLPIVEAMKNKIKVFCSDIPIFREVGGEYPQYFNLQDPTNLTNLIRHSEQYSTKLGCPDWINWDQAVSILFQKILSR